MTAINGYGEIADGVTVTKKVPHRLDPLNIIADFADSRGYDLTMMRMSNGVGAPGRFYIRFHTYQGDPVMFFHGKDMTDAVDKAIEWIARELNHALHTAASPPTDE